MHHEPGATAVGACSRIHRGLDRPHRRLALVLMALLVAFAGVALAQGDGDDQRSKEIVRELLDAMRAKNAERIRAVFSENASQAYGQGSPKSGAAFRAWLQSDIIDREGQVSDPQLSAVGGEVVVNGQFANNAGYTSAANFLFKIENGRIVSWQMRY